ncbi:unnamed protein product [Peronospora belbahrii]|uniref:procollagen-lysine 5-dioxygenase n=1 Tax=Peronospora belbahrii TaxID=622444 RepID=A0AAU9KNL9_9STRA|nr:unnamed protein product [Peronospora belbahrii]CAH0514730.1 unnamed protein product [Peronospora belbahrii]
MDTTTLFTTLSPQLQALVEASLGTKLPTTCTKHPIHVEPTIQEDGNSLSCTTEVKKMQEIENVSNLDPSDLFALKHPESPGFIVKKEFLGRQHALAVSDALKDLAPNQTFYEAKVGIGDNARNDQTVRGDKILWIQTPSDLDLSNGDKRTSHAILYLRRQVESLVYGLKKVSPDMGLQNIVSMQLAIFSGNGSRFVKHCDTNLNALREEDGVKSKNGLVRLITCVYYLNDQWEPEHGGHLRVHLKESKVLPSCRWDIPPKLDTLVVFRSLDVEHEVLPTYRERKALTIWYYGKPPLGLPCQVKSSKADGRSVPQPPFLATDNRPDHAKHASIFVAIPSYRDSECRHTVDNLLAQATFSDRVFVGICLQTDSSDNAQSYLQSKYSPSKIRVHWMDYREAAGPCVARAQAQKLWQGEEFYLQIDSHMRFRPGWDCFLINELEKCFMAKPILTTYPLGYTLPNEISTDSRPTLLCASSFDKLGMLRQTSKLLAKALTEPLPSLFWAAGFAFSSSKVIAEVPYDDELRFLFFGEESSMAARLWTSGWNFFAPSETVAYHLWTRSYRPVFQELETEETQRCRNASIQCVKRLLRFNKNSENEEGQSKHTLGSERSFDSYQKHIGVDFATGNIEWWAEWGNIDPIRFELKTKTEKLLTPV